MKNSKNKKVVAVLLTTSMLCGMTACSGNSEQTTTAATTTTINEKQELDSVDWGKLSADTVSEENEGGTGSLYESGKTAGAIKGLCYYDFATTQPDLAAMFAERYGGTVETEICASGSGYYERLAALIAADDAPDLVRYDWMAYPWGTSKNAFTALDDWLDMDSPLWADEKEVIESFNYGGKHYYFPSSVSVNFAIIYNRLVLEEAGLDDPLELYKSGNWNWDTFEELMTSWANQGTDYVGFTGGSWSSMMFANTTGTKVIDVTGSDIINNLKNQNVQRAMDRLAEMKRKGLIGEGFVDPGQAFLDGKLLFLGMGLTWGFESAQEIMTKNGIEHDMVALPFPKDPNSDKFYLSSDSFGFMVPSGAKNIQGAVDWILCGRIYETDPETVAADYAKKTSTDPVYFAKCPSCKYSFTENNQDDLSVCPECGAARKEKFKAVYSEEQMQVIADMKDPTKFSFVFDNTVGFSDDFSSLFIGTEETIFDGPIYYGSSFSQLRDNYEISIDSYLEPFRTAIQEAATKNGAAE